MQKFEKFTEEYLEVADNELTSVINFSKDLLWFIVSLLLLVVSLPLWLVGQLKRHLTKRAPDAGDSAAFSSIFLASSFFCSQTESTPTHTQVTQTVGTPLAKNERKYDRHYFGYKTWR